MHYLKEGKHLLILDDTLKLPTATNLMPSVRTHSTGFNPHSEKYSGIINR
jgi:hypothetical protein